MTDTPFAHTVALSESALLHIEGPDSERFLQGQLTCDVAGLARQHWTLGACCNAKGRMVANFVIARDGDSFWLRLPQAQAVALQQHLSRYAVFFKTSMTLADNYHLSGHLPARLPLVTLSGQHPLRVDSGVLLLSWPDGREEVWSPAGTDAEENDGLWQQQDLALGLVWVQEASREAWVPQYIGWQIQGGVSFKKGCYTGQEIVARLQYLGKSKKYLVAVHSDEHLQPSVLTDVLDAQGKSIGEIAAWYGQQGLAVIQGSLPDSACVSEKPVKLATLFYTEDNHGADTPVTSA